MLLLAAVACAPACMTQRRAERKIERLAMRFPELTETVRVEIDTAIVVPSRTDSTVFALYGTGHRQPVEVHTRQGVFTMAIDTATKLAHVTYTTPPDTVRYTRVVEVPHIVVQSADRRKLRAWRIVAIATTSLLVFLTTLFLVSGDMKRKKQ